MKEPRTYKNEKGETEVTLAFTEKKEDELCDFCSSLKPPYKEYPCRDFQHPLSPLHWSRGEWNACDKCSELIDAGDREGLLQRSLMMASFEHELSAEAEIMTRAFHNAFFANRFMPPTEEELERLWKEQKGVAPETGEMWLTPRMERDAAKLQEAWAKQQLESAPPAPISGQPELPGSHSSFHNQGGGFPDANPSK